MRIALVCPYDMGRFGGVQNQVKLMAEELGRRGHDAWIVAPGEPTGPMFSLGPARTLRVNDSSAPIKLSPVLVPKLRRAVAPADVVHVHEPLMPLVSIACRWVGRPLVGTFHADPSRSVRWLYDRMPPLRWHMKAYRDLAAVSETARAAVQRLGDIQVVPNGVATPDLPEAARVPGRVVWVGRNDPRKGLDIALAAMRLVRSRQPNAHLVVITPDEVAAEEGVDVRRGLDDAAKLELLASTEVFVAPNRRGESFGLVVAEAMAAGCACVVSDIPAFAAVAGDAAELVPAEDPAALADAVGTLLADSAVRSELGARAKSRAAEFSIAKTVEAYLPMYKAAAG